MFAASFEYSSNHDLATALRYTEALRLVPGTTHLVATHDGEAVACASLNVVDGVGWLGGAATIPQLRGHGVHADLLDHRLALAIELGCDILAATALPSGSSARNLHRAGFQLGWTQVVMTR
ncbi:MAG: GNAT family N-acetyltransferase [Actinomycetota bacterium]|nr:GNAT family N-acetyltransferase [Actinomycetota bacterium]